MKIEEIKKHITKYINDLKYITIARTKEEYLILKYIYGFKEAEIIREYETNKK